MSGNNSFLDMVKCVQIHFHSNREMWQHSNDTSPFLQNNYYRRLFDARIGDVPSLEQSQILAQNTATFYIKSEIDIIYSQAICIL